MRHLQSSPFFIRFLISICFLIFQVFNGINLRRMWQSQQDENQLPIRICITIPTLLQLLLFYQIPNTFQFLESLSFFFKWNILCYVPTPKGNFSQENQKNLTGSILYYQRLQLINLLSVMNLVLFLRSDMENCFISQFISSQFGILTSLLMFELTSDLDKKISTIYSKIFCKFFLLNLFIGYAGICNFHFWCVLLIMQLLAALAYFHAGFLKLLKFGFQHDAINSNYGDSFVEVFGFMYFSKLNIGFSQRPIAEIVGTKQEYQNLNAGLYALLLFSAVIWDFFNRETSQANQLGRYFLHAYTLIFSKILLLITLNLYRFITKGPFQRKIIIDCQEIEVLTDSQIILNYFSFKPQQIQIAISFKNSNLNQIRRILQLVLAENKRKITFQIETQQLNQSFSFTSPSLISSDLIDLYLGDVAYARVILEEIAKSQYFSYRFALNISCKTGNKLTNRAILNVLLQNYCVIPNILTFPTYTTEEIHVVRAVVLQVIAFNKNMKQAMQFCSKQIVYDIFEEFNSQK